MDERSSFGLLEYRIKQVEERGVRMELKMDDMQRSLATKSDVADVRELIETNRRIIEKREERSFDFWVKVLGGPILVALVSAFTSYAIAAQAHH